MHRTTTLAVVALVATVTAVTAATSAQDPIHVSTIIRARRGPAPDPVAELREAGQWTPAAKLALAQALWGEAGIRSTYARTRPRRGRVVSCDHVDAATECFENRDWRLVPWALATRWSELRARGRRFTFEGLVRAYCASVKPSLASEAREAMLRRRGDDRGLRQVMRRRFLIGLTWDGSNLVEQRRAYGHRAPPDLYRDGWTSITDLVERWGRGEVPNECPGIRHWAMVGAPVSAGHHRLDCGETLNAWYGDPAEVAVALENVDPPLPPHPLPRREVEGS